MASEQPKQTDFKWLKPFKYKDYYWNSFSKWRFFLLFPICLIYMEVIAKIFTCDRFFDWGLLFMPLFSLPVAFVLTLFCTFFNQKQNRGVAIGIMTALFLIFSTQVVYHWVFGKYVIIYSVTVGGADQIIESGIFETAVAATKASVLPVLLLSVPLIATIILTGRLLPFYKTTGLQKLFAAISSVSFHFVVVLLAVLIPATNEVYLGSFDPNLTVGYFGLARTEVMDMQYNILGFNPYDNLVSDSSGGSSVDNTSSVSSSQNTGSPLYSNQVMDIDFKSLASSETDDTIKSMHNYFAAVAPTRKNNYTGMFKGYNLIQITAEGFSPYAIDKNLTPTLYKMYTEGFKFNNFYTPIWGVSTSDGEYVNGTGLIPKSGVWSFYLSGKQKNYLPFTMGQQFLNIGVNPIYAYHDHTYTYYHRDISHPNMGYIYKGYGNGLESKLTKSWPESDLEMMNATGPEYIKPDKQFHAYYMTVSGHMQYSFKENAMSAKNKKLVENLKCSDTLKAYYAANIELDRAMESLLKQLQAAGVADKTVISLTPDHYPYGLEDKENENMYHYFDEMLGHKVETNFELYKSVYLLYNPGMKQPITVDKYSSSLDIIPTLSNLFGFEYDSRLLMGRDILSDSEPLVLFSNRSWITDKGRYNARTKKFQLFKGQTLANQEEYVAKMKTIVNNKFVVSAQILDNDYYGKVFKNKK